MSGKESEMPPFSFIQEYYTQDTGGGFDCDVLILDDGTVLVISEESIVLYEDTEAWEEDPGRQKGTILRFTDPSINAPSN